MTSKILQFQLSSQRYSQVVEEAHRQGVSVNAYVQQTIRLVLSNCLPLSLDCRDVSVVSVGVDLDDEMQSALGQLANDLGLSPNRLGKLVRDIVLARRPKMRAEIDADANTRAAKGAERGFRRERMRRGVGTRKDE